jgi:hypothetical protein
MVPALGGCSARLANAAASLEALALARVRSILCLLDDKWNLPVEDDLVCCALGANLDQRGWNHGEAVFGTTIGQTGARTRANRRRASNPASWSVEIHSLDQKLRSDDDGDSRGTADVAAPATAEHQPNN